MTTRFIGQRGRLFRMAFFMGLLTVLTVGFYRFWMKTRLRRYYWSSIRIGSHHLEYVGQPLEKLLGFFIAVVILAFYIGIVNLILMVISFSLFDGNTAAYIASFVGVIPLWFYARYRARRYVLARTRWRGIRFGVDPGAWGYAWRAMVHWSLTILSLGLLWPRMTFWLEKFRIDRTWYGDRQIEQGGNSTMLIKGMLPFWLVVALTVAAGVHSYLSDDVEIAAFALIAAVPMLAVTWAWYSVRSFRLLTNAKSAGNIHFLSKARAPRVIGIYIFGYTVTWILTSIAAGIAAVVFLAVWLVSIGEGFSFEAVENLANPGLTLQIAGFAIYFIVFVIWASLRHVFVTLPIWRHYADTLTLIGTESLHDIRQRERDEHREAEGFAEALDLGAAI
ncbi:MAG: DUF898 family protein [Boseongicola sp.]|nr:MAG: DUF898 family protein [Boseongicola sp.]